MTVKKSVNLELEALKFMAREEKKRIRKLERDARQHEKEDTQLKKWLEYISNNKKCYEEMEDHDMSEEDCTKKENDDTETFIYGLDSNIAKHYLFFQNSMMRKLIIGEKMCNKRKRRVKLHCKFSKLSKEWSTATFDGRKLTKHLNKIIYRIKVIEIQIAATNLSRFIDKPEKNKTSDDVLENEIESFCGHENMMKSKEVEDLETQVASVCGKGGEKKKGKQLMDGEKMKSAFNDICTVDALVNLFRSTDYLDVMKNHDLCNHVEKCSACILRSAICKTELGKGVAVGTPEIIHNLTMFLGEIYCPECLTSYSNKEDQIMHMQENVHEKKSLSLKNTLDTLLSAIGFIDELHLSLLCTECGQDMNKYKHGYIILPKTKESLEKSLSLTVSEMINFHQENNMDCTNGSHKINKYPENLLLMMLPDSITSVDQRLMIGKEMYYLKAQVYYNNGHFCTRKKLSDDTYYSFDGHNSIQEKTAADPKHTFIALFQKTRLDIQYLLEDYEKFIYPSKSIKYFRESTAQHKKEKKDYVKTKYHTDIKHREEKQNKAKEVAADSYKDPRKREEKQNKAKEVAADSYKDPIKREEKLSGQKDQKKKKYEGDSEFQNKAKEVAEDSYKDPRKREEKLRGQKDQKKKKYDEQTKFRNKAKTYSLEYYRKGGKIWNLIDKHFNAHDSGMEYICASCIRTHNRNNVSKYRQSDTIKETDSKLLLIGKTKNQDGWWYLCSNCRPALIKGLPKLNFSRVNDLNTIGSIPRDLPDLNLMEQYLLKLTIPFIRVAHVPRSPNLKLVGGSVCIQANICHTVERLKIKAENIIPISFKRKLAYTGHYLEQVINKSKVLLWLNFLQKNNPLYKNIVVSDENVKDEIDIMEEKLISELVSFDEYRILKEQLAEKKETEENKITKDIQPYLTDSDEEDEESESEEIDAKTEVLHDKEIHSNDTFLYHVNELNLDEKTVTNEIARFIDKNEKENFKLREYVKDEFCPENENFLFKAESEDEELASVIEETIVIKEDDGSCEEEKNISEDTEEEGEEKKLREIFKSFSNKFCGKRKRSQEKPERKEKEKKEKPEREKATVVAPGENQPFDNDFKYQEEKCFPTLFPMGQGQC